MANLGDSHNGPPAPLPELTLRAVLLSIALAAVLAAANAYMGLFAGTTLSASIPAAVLSMALLRRMRRSTRLENNLVQTAASAGESLAGGIIFTVPALVILQARTDFGYLETTAVALLGGLAGVLCTVPLRRAFLTDPSLRFPEGVATAEVIEVGDRGPEAARPMILAAVAGALFKLGEVGLQLWPATMRGAMSIGNTVVAGGFRLSPALIAVGAIVGHRVALLILIGGAVNWLVAIPLLGVLTDAPGGAEPVPALSRAMGLWQSQTRYLGVGAMAAGGLWTLVRVRHSLRGALRATVAAVRPQDHGAAGRDRDLPPGPLAIMSMVVVFGLLGLTYSVLGSLWLAALMTLFTLVAIFLFSAVAAHMAGLVGSANNPISGISVATVLLASLLLAGLGAMEGVGPTAAILMAAAVSCAAAIGSDNMQDLKAGALLGAAPYRQQWMQIVGVVAGALLVAPTLSLLLDAYGIGVASAAHPHPLEAPQATLMAELTRSVFVGGVPWSMIGLGALFAVLVVAVDARLEERGSSWRAPVLAVAVGLYLPIDLSLAIFAGGLLAAWLSRGDDGGAATPQRGRLLAAAGLITGEAVVGVLVAIPVVLAGDARILALGLESSTVLGVVGFLVVIGVFMRLAGARGASGGARG